MKIASLTRFAALACSLLIMAGSLSRTAAQEFPGTVVLFDQGFPPVDTTAVSQAKLASLLPAASFVPAAQLASVLNDSSTRLLVLPYGSAFPEEQWSSIYGFLRRGGNLLVLGGRPFTRAAYRDGSAWKLRDYGVRFTRQLMIDQYQITPGSDDSAFQTNPDVIFQPPQFAWKQAYSPVIRLSAVALYDRGGAAGSMDARLDALAWGVRDGQRLSAPVIEIDHLRNGFDGSRWVFVNSNIMPAFYDNAALVRGLADRAIQGSEEFTARPTLPLYLPGEPVELDVHWTAAQQSTKPLSLKITTYPADQPTARSIQTANFPASQALMLPAPGTKGLHIIEAELLDGEKPRAIYRSAYWIRDEAYLRSGSRMTVNSDYFEIDGHPLAVVGTTYMASDAQRLYFEHPNVYVWDRDLAHIHSAGLNMIRSGWWTGWDKFFDENGQPYERTLRTIEAFLMTARRYNLPVQFNFFAFLPDVFGGANSYLDPSVVHRQQAVVSAVVSRFHDVPYLAWDLINEPSFSKHLWKMRPNDDGFELGRWNEWLDRRYPNRAALAAAWNVAPAVVEGTIPLPKEAEFAPRGMYNGDNSLKLYDYSLFAQQSFAEWVKRLRETIRTTGSQQLITVGQDEGGFVDRLSPAFFAPYVDFTTNHSWWQNDHILWDSLVAKQPDKTMLIQETGLQRELSLDEVARRTPQNEAALLERKIASSFVQGSGAIEWLWNSNSYMTEGNETPIGAVFPDGTEKPEATVLRAFAAFAKPMSEHLQAPAAPPVAIITSQAAQFSALQDLQIEAQRKAVRAMAYGARLMPYVIAENQIASLGPPKLAVLPSSQAITEVAWQTLLKYVSDGGTLLVTGPISRDEHWRLIPRQADLKLEGSVEPLTFHNADLNLGDQSLLLSFDMQAQSWLDVLRFNDGSTLKDVSYGKGRVFWTSYPVELAQGLEASTQLYSYVAGKIGLKPVFELRAPLSPGVLIYATELRNSVLYVMTADTADDAQIDLRDGLTGTPLSLNLKAEHAAMAVIDKATKSVVAKYGF